MGNELEKWLGGPAIRIDDSVEITSILEHVPALRETEVRQISRALESADFELATSFVWNKAVSHLGHLLAVQLGMEFIGEMLGRPDINAHSSPSRVLLPNDVLNLAFQLGMVGYTDHFRLVRAMDTIQHFTDAAPGGQKVESMAPEEALAILRPCLKGILSQTEDGVVRFAEFRKQLELSSLQPDDEAIEVLVQSPYFFKRTTVVALLTAAKTLEGARRTHVLHNIVAIVPQLWDTLSESDKYLAGQTYSDAMNHGLKDVATAIRSALRKVRGFDYVPEDLRSRTFVSAANRLLEAHRGWDNFYKEFVPLKELLDLGTVIPEPALSKSLTAIVAVAVGNPWGVARDAGPLASRYLSKLPPARWVAFFDLYLPFDTVLLTKFHHSVIGRRWNQFVQEHVPGDLPIRTLVGRRLYGASQADSAALNKVALAQLKSLAEH